jgi:hypothetical protein
MTLDSRLSSPIEKDDTLSLFPQITHLRLYFRPFDVSVLQRLLNSVPSVRRFSIDTLIYNVDYIRAPFWTLLFQQRLPLLERIRLVVRGWYISKTNNSIEGKFDGQNLIGGYRYDRYWLDRAYKRIFTCYTGAVETVLQIR